MAIQRHCALKGHTQGASLQDAIDYAIFHPGLRRLTAPDPGLNTGLPLWGEALMQLSHKDYSDRKANAHTRQKGITALHCRVLMPKSTPLDLEYLQFLNSTLNEWDSMEDEIAYQNL